ncbi:MAG: serine hydrolase [Chitinophaga sp.]|uniref:serine hydrolase n=1 Tax=Chitinophaga sp. TaxID=1869181 RepID=UPI001B2BC894|nr:serine hydrolase [Chitinophaga sp.]MBO9730294.1 serine hydrolase [Chitinophaga sp.]
MSISFVRAGLSAFCCVGIMSLANAQSPAQKLEKIDAALSDILKEEHGAGFAIAVVEKNKVVFTKGFGYRDVAGKLPVTPHTQFAIGSCTKAFTSALLGNLRKDGKVDFDKPATTYLPALDFSDPTLNYQVTLRDMMCHRTGFSRYDLAWYFFNTSSRDTLLQRMHYMKPTAPLRSRWQYNNFMFMVQGMVAERLTGQSWEQNINSQIFQPLGMSESSIGTVALAAAPEPSLGYTTDNNNKGVVTIKLQKYHPIIAMGPAGAINSTATDMAKWLITWVNGGRYAQKEVLAADYVKEAISSQMIMDASAPNPETPFVQFGNYGFGWMLYAYRGHYRVEHGGNVDGFTALTTFYPIDSIGIVVLSNQGNSRIPSRVINAVSDQLFGVTTPAKKKGKPVEDTSKPYVDPNFKAHPTTHPIQAFTGVFRNNAFGDLNIYQKGDSLFAGLPDFTWHLYHEDYNIYSPYDAADTVVDRSEKSNMRLQFLMNATGDIDRLSFTYDPSGDPVIFDKQLPKVEIDAAAYAKLAGVYRITGTAITIRLSDAKELQMDVPGQPVYILEAIDKDMFSLKGIKGYKVQFVRDDKGDIIGLISIQPNGSFRALKDKQ